MDRIIHTIIFGIILITFALFGAAIVDNDSQAQLDIMYTCYNEYTEAEFAQYCRNELDGFDHIIDLQGSARQYAALASL